MSAAKLQAMVKRFQDRLMALETATDTSEEWIQFVKWKDVFNVPDPDWELGFLVSRDSFIQSVFVKSDQDTPETREALMTWNFGIPGGWGYCISHSRGSQQLSLSPPFDHNEELFHDGEPLFVYGHHDRVSKSLRDHFVVCERIVNALGVFWVEDLGAYCQIDELGDLDPVIVIRDLETPDLSFILIKKNALDVYLVASRQRHCKLFEIRRAVDWSAINGTTRTDDEKRSESFRYRETYHVRGDKVVASFRRGGMIRLPNLSEEEAINVVEGKDAPPKQYASFLIWDWKNKQLVETEIGPGKLANYFTKSDLPFETSPVFFKSEVLKKYKDNPEKFELHPRRIYCRGAWSLETYDINEAGQVHTYACYLARLPHPEQLYWKSYNEAPIGGGISERAFKTDFLAEWADSEEPLHELKQAIQLLSTIRLPQDCEPLWLPKDGTLEKQIASVFYQVTESQKEWKEFNIALATATVDGLQVAAIRKYAEKLGCLDKQLGSMKQLRKCLEKKGINAELLGEAFMPLEELWQDRGPSAHGGASRPTGSLRLLARSRMAAIAASIKEICKFISE